MSDLFPQHRKGDLMTAILRKAGSKVEGRGRWRKVRCISPNHEDKNPSASVNLMNDTAGYKCFSCGLTGDPWKLGKILWGMSPQEVNRLIGL